MQHILVHDNLVVFWIFIQFKLRQSNYVQYRSAYLQVVNLNASAKIYRSLWFSYFCRHVRTFCECHYIHIWEICIPRSVQPKQILIGRFVECQSIKKVGGRRSVEELYQALFFVSPFPPECFTHRNENRAWSQVTTLKSEKTLGTRLRMEIYSKWRLWRKEWESLGTRYAEGQPRSTRNDFPIRPAFGKFSANIHYGGLSIQSRH